jgi:hypothetical protein
MLPQIAPAKSDGWKYLSLFGMYQIAIITVTGANFIRVNRLVSPVTMSPKLDFPSTTLRSSDVRHKDNEAFPADHLIERD